MTLIPESILSKADVLLNVDEATREDWLKMRECGLGGSDALAASGLSPYKSPYALWLEKTGMVRFPDEDKQPKPGVLEIKNTSSWNAKDWDEEPPLYAVVQNLHYQIVLGLKWGYVAGLIGGNHLAVHKVALDDDVEADILTLEHSFWNKVMDTDPPALDGSDSTLEALKLKYSEPEEERIELPNEALDLIEMLGNSQGVIATHNAKIKGIKAQMMDWLGNNTEGVIGDSLVTWKPNKKGVRSMRFTKLKEE